MKRRIYLLTILLGFCSAFSATAQQIYSSSGKPIETKTKQTSKDDEKLIDPSRFIFGGWGLFGIGAGVTNLGITPIFGYRITDDFYAGIGFGYQYFRAKDAFFVITDPNTGGGEGRPLNMHIYSPSVWMRYMIWNNIFANVEYEQNISTFKEYTNDFSKFPPPEVTIKQTLNVPSLLVGGGIRQPIGERTSFVIIALYDVLQEKYSPYKNTLAFRFGINVGF